MKIGPEGEEVLPKSVMTQKEAAESAIRGTKETLTGRAERIAQLGVNGLLSEPVIGVTGLSVQVNIKDGVVGELKVYGKTK